MIKKSLIQTTVLTILTCTVLVLVGCGNPKSSSSSDGATQADIDALSKIVGKQLSLGQPESPESSSFSVKGSLSTFSSRVYSISNGTELSFINDTLTVQDNKVTYNSNEYTYDFGFSDGSSKNYYNFSRQISDNEDTTVNQNLSIYSSPEFTSNFIELETIYTSDTRSTTNITLNGKVTYGDPSSPDARFDISNASTVFIGHSDTEYTYTATMPFTLTIEDLSYTGEFTGSGHEIDGEPIEDEIEETSSILTRNGKEVGVITLSDDNTIKVFIKNKNGSLEELIVN